MLIHKGYVGKVEYDDEADIFHGEVIGLRDVVTFQAETAKGIKEEFVASVEDYLEFCAEKGRTPEKPYSGKFVLRLPYETHKAASLAAKHNGVSLNQWIVTHIHKAIENEFPQFSI